MMITGLIKEVREIVARQRAQGAKIGLVPTMGYLHDGHLALVKRAKEEGCFVVMSIFVNPLQFGPNEDYDRYPRDLERDTQLAAQAGVDVIFHPEVKEMYPDPHPLTIVHVRELDRFLCGASRPGHFVGVTTVVMKLFNIVQPDMAFFGQKDYQQAVIIRQMVRDLNMPVEIVTVPIVREADGLAMSSRNVYLTPEQRAEATILNRSLIEGERLIRAGERDPRKVEEHIKQLIATTSGEIDYVEVRRASDLKAITHIDTSVVMLVAVRFGTTRLIDNRVVELDV